MIIRRYCPVCKHTTHHRWNEETEEVKCISRTHANHAKKQEKLRAADQKSK